MKRLRFMVVAGEPSGDTLAAELVRALKDELARFLSQPTEDLQPRHASLAPEFFGMGGPSLAAEGVELVEDMSAYSVFGVTDVLKRYFDFRALMRHLVRLALARQPDVILCVDYSGFNRRLARAVKDHVRASEGTFRNWDPKIVQFVSPQVWASRPGRARQMARDFDLVLSIFPFEKAWYAARAPELRVEFVGHPMLERFSKPRSSGGNEAHSDCGWQIADCRLKSEPPHVGCYSSDVGAEECGREVKRNGRGAAPSVVLLPGSRRKELKRHLPVIVAVARHLLARQPVTLRLIVPNEKLAAAARVFTEAVPQIQVQTGGLADALAQADLAIASSGTVTMECALFGVPTVVLYKLSWPEFQIARRIVRVKHIAMPNLLAGEAVFPEFIQGDATPDNLARAALDFLRDNAKRRQVQDTLKRVISSLGGPGATRRAAQAIVRLLG
ncbi:MAG: hypothetical protein HZA90_25950 [Verrucomicrobia bacterium]|nr:hypothetical protein [Verrucomicrobiota bacterium]